MIYSALYYPASLARGELIIRDNRYYPCKYSESFPLWWAYLRKHYPNEHVTLFCDTKSPINIGSILNGNLVEAWEEEGMVYPGDDGSKTPRVHVRWLSEHTNKYFWTMQRNIVAGLIDAYVSNQDFLWLDNDAFLNTDILSLIHSAGVDVAAPQITHYQQTMDSVCTFISSNRLHQLDDLGVDLPEYLTNMLNHGPTDTRMHSLQEGGLYKTFCYGKTLALADKINLSHLSCYDHFLEWLKANPLDLKEYHEFVEQLEKVDWAKMPGVERVFHDMHWTNDERGRQL